MDIRKEIDKWRGFHKFNCIRITATSKKHFLAICEKAWELHKLKHKFITEAKMINGDEIDIIDLKTGEYWEFETNPKEDKRRGERVQL